MSHIELHTSETAAIHHVALQARARRQLALAALDEVCSMSNIAYSAFEQALASIRQYARIALHFHPDRPDAHDRTVAQNLLASGIYKSQFETLLSNGSVSAYPGGARDLWERKLFGGAYHGEGVLDAHRPKYGALDLMRHADGPSPRFGSCYFVLAQPVSQRATFTYLDSHQDPIQKGTLVELDDVLAALFLESFTRDFAIGEKNMRPAQLVERLRTRLHAPYADPAGLAPTRNLDHYIEAQVHGAVRLREDVELLVADPSFRETPTGATLWELAERYEIRLCWHAGFWLAAHEVPSDFRGTSAPQLAARIARNGKVDAATIGEAARALQRDPDDWPIVAGVLPLQQLKLLWHVLVRYGHVSPVLT